jgi:hypothetical protein
MFREQSRSASWTIDFCGRTRDSPMRSREFNPENHEPPAVFGARLSKGWTVPFQVSPFLSRAWPRQPWSTASRYLWSIDLRGVCIILYLFDPVDGVCGILTWLSVEDENTDRLLKLREQIWFSTLGYGLPWCLRRYKAIITIENFIKKSHREEVYLNLLKREKKEEGTLFIYK